ncbi:MAG: FAD-binding protein [Thermomicrobiales bacterium]
MSHDHSGTTTERTTNWAGNYTYRAKTIHRPVSIEELQSIVSKAHRIRALGTGHTFNSIPDSAELISLQGIDPNLTIDREAMTVTVGAGIRYGELGPALHAEGLALHNTGSLPHICIGGATATATHGSGDRNRNLASAVSGIELVTAGGDIIQARRGDADFPGMVVHLGALGIATRLTLDVQPTFDACQEVFEDLSWSDLTTNFDGIFSCAYSVSIFTYYRETAGVIWVKHRLEDGVVPSSVTRWSATPARQDRNPMDGWSSVNCTPQMMVPGPWYQRLPHFRLEDVPASGEEIQSEYMVDRSRAVDVIAALRAFEPEMREFLLVGEIRSIAADDLWLSTAYQRDTVAFHFSWLIDTNPVERLLPRLEEMLKPFDVRPHWGKAFAATAHDLAPRYERLTDFRQLMSTFDPDGKFRNEFIDQRVLGA